MKGLLNIAHRGASGYAPENTLAAFRLAQKLGADMIEFDVRESSDGRLVVVHDASLRRTAGSARRVEALSLSEIRRLDAGSWFHSRFRDERIPTLEEVLQVSGVDFNLEIKKANPKKVVEAILRASARPRAILSSFEHGLLEGVRKLDPEIRIGYLAERESERKIWEDAVRLQAFSLHLPGNRVTPSLLEKAHLRGLAVFVFTLNQKREMRRFIDWGVDGIFTNYPDRLSALIRPSAL